MAQITLLSPTTSATQSNVFRVLSPEKPVTLIIGATSGHTASEYSDLQISYDGTNWEDVYSNGAQQRLSSTNTVLVINAVGLYRVDKEATTNAVGVYLVSRKNIP